MKLVDLIFFLLIGLIAGWLAGQLLRGGGYGVVGRTVIGTIGALLGAWLFSRLGLRAGHLVASSHGQWGGQMWSAFLGALVLIAIARAIRRV
jgi:uncharacterized membrane protein YeaQ/YmgE (transglycosylase-associated protein family)